MVRMVDFERVDGYGERLLHWCNGASLSLVDVREAVKVIASLTIKPLNMRAINNFDLEAAGVGQSGEAASRDHKRGGLVCLPPAVPPPNPPKKQDLGLQRWRRSKGF